MPTPETRLHTCMLCEAACGIAVEVDGDRAVAVRGDRDDPFSQGHICPKAAALEDVRLDPDRVTSPRVDGRRASWDEALDLAAEKLARAHDVHGRDAVAMYLGNPMAHSYAGLFGATLLWSALGTRARFSATSLDQLPHMLAALKMFGHQALLPVPDVDRTDYLLVLGANPIVSNGSVMTAPGIAKRLERLRARGGKLVVVDPRRTETAEVADRHLFIRPGTDALLLLAMLNVIFAEKRARLGRLAAFTDGVDALARACEGFPPDAVAIATGIEARAIAELAREFASAKRAACYGRIGICTQDFGGAAAWLAYALDVVTGNLDAEGGAMFTTPAVDIVRIATMIGLKGSFATFRSQVRGLPEFGGELPAACLAEEIEAGHIRALVTVAGNPVLSTPNGARLARALDKLEFMASIDLYENETTRHADVLLPSTFGLERDHYDVVLGAVSVRNTARWAPAIFAPAGETRHDWDIAIDLGRRICARGRPNARRVATRAVASVLLRVGPRRSLDWMLRRGPHGLSLKKLEEHPHGLDLGALEPRLPALLATKGRRIDLAPSLYLEELPRLEARMRAGAAQSGGLLLIGRRHLRSNNSWMHNSRRLVKGPERCTLLMHPEDARARGLGEGARVRVRSRAGEIVSMLEISDAMARGVVSMPHGWGHDRGARLSVASERPGASINDVTDEARVDALSANASFSGTPVEVSLA